MEELAELQKLAAIAPPVIYGGQPVGDPILDAAALCVERNGFDNTSLEAIATAAGVSRTTIYRRFGNRELLLKALLIERARPFSKWANQIYLGPGSVRDRIETVLVYSILEMQRVGWLDRTLRAGLSATSIRLFKASHAHGADIALAPLLASLMDGRAGASHVTVAELIDWKADQMIVLASAAPWEAEVLRERVRFFVMPVLVPAPQDDGVSARLGGIEQKLDVLLARASG